jgi:hypothetical protein
MSEKNRIHFPDKGIWSSIKSVKSQKVNHLTVTTGEDMAIIDTPLAFDLRLIPRVFTAPLQAIGLVTSIFARMLDTNITLYLNDDKE